MIENSQYSNSLDYNPCGHCPGAWKCVKHGNACHRANGSPCMTMKEGKQCEPHFGGNPSDFRVDMPFWLKLDIKITENS